MRPANPSLSTWATGNYGAGGNLWNAQPKRTLPVTVYWTPNTKIPAEEINYAVGDLVDATNGLFDFIGQNQQNMVATCNKTAVTGYGGGLLQLKDVHYSRLGDVDTYEGRANGSWISLWIEDDGSNGKCYIALTEDGGLTWTHIKDGANNHVASRQASRIASNGSNLWVQLETDATNFRRYIFSTNTWSNVAHNAGEAIRVQTYTYFNSLQIVYGFGANGHQLTCSAGTWTNRDAQLSSTAQKTRAALCCSPTVAVLWAANNLLMTSTDGTTWTNRTAVAQQINEICYSSVLGKFFAVCGDSHTYSSSDGITWSDLGATSKEFSSIRAQGSLLVATDVGNGSNGQYSTWYSTNGGTVWKVYPGFRLPTDSGDIVAAYAGSKSCGVRAADHTDQSCFQMAQFCGGRLYIGSRGGNTSA